MTLKEAYEKIKSILPKDNTEEVRKKSFENHLIDAETYASGKAIEAYYKFLEEAIKEVEKGKIENELEFATEKIKKKILQIQEDLKPLDEKYAKEFRKGIIPEKMILDGKMSIEDYIAFTEAASMIAFLSSLSLMIGNQIHIAIGNKKENKKINKNLN